MDTNDISTTGDIVSESDTSMLFPQTTDELLTRLRDLVNFLAPLAFTSQQAEAIGAFRLLDESLTGGAPLPTDWRGKDDGDGTVYRPGLYRTGAGEYDSFNDPNEQE